MLRLNTRTTGALGAIRGEIERANPGSTVSDVSTLGDRLFASVRARAFVTFVASVFGLSGRAVCMAGLAPMVAFTVAQRTRGIAIRMTLGATPPLARRLAMLEACVAAVAMAVLVVPACSIPTSRAAELDRSVALRVD